MSTRRSDIIRFYDTRFNTDHLLAEYYKGSDFYNFGYWADNTRCQNEACENLMEKLLGFIRQKKGIILDVACGMGATSRYLLKHYNPSEVTGINISTKQLETCKANAPGCAFLQMDAAKLALHDRVFDNIICVEAAFHFDTREDFLREVCQVLKPGGQLVLSDILVNKLAARWHPRIPKENWVTDMEEYRELYLRAGFKHVEVVDATKECWKGFYKHLWSWRRKNFLAGEIKLPAYAKMILRNLLAKAGLKYYLLVSARKA